MEKANRRPEIAVRSSVCKKQTTAYDYENEDLGRASFLRDGLYLINLRIGPYHSYQKVHTILGQLLFKPGHSPLLKYIDILT